MKPIVKTILKATGILATLASYIYLIEFSDRLSRSAGYDDGARDYTPRYVITKKLNSDDLPDLIIYSDKGVFPMIANIGEGMAGTYTLLWDYEKKLREDAQKKIVESGSRQDAVNAEHQFLQTKNQIEGDLERELQKIRKEAGLDDKK